MSPYNISDSIIRLRCHLLYYLVIVSMTIISMINTIFLCSLLFLYDFCRSLAFSVSVVVVARHYLSGRPFLNLSFHFLCISTYSLSMSPMLWIVWWIIDEVRTYLINVKESPWSHILRRLIYHFAHLALFHYLKFF